jgi:hypothetical protein
LHRIVEQVGQGGMMGHSARAGDKSGSFYVDDQTLGGTERDLPID